MRYSFSVSDRQVICSSTYAGKPVIGVAKCAPEDTFDVKYGKKLARLRCDLKVAKKRWNNELHKYNFACEKEYQLEIEKKKRICRMASAAIEIDKCMDAILELV